MFSPALAVASTVAFSLSETLDLAVYTPLRARNRYVAMAASNVVGLAVDSAVFLTLAFGDLTWLPGQLLGKTWATAAGIGAIGAWQHRSTATRRSRTTVAA